MSGSIDKKKHEEMERLANSIIEFKAIGRSTKIIDATVGQQLLNCISKTCGWWPYIDNMSGSVFDGMPNEVCGDIDQMVTMQIFPVVRWQSQALVTDHEWGYVMAEHNPNHPVYLRLNVVDKECLHESIKTTVDNGYMKSTEFINSYKYHDLGGDEGVRMYKVQGPATVSAGPMDQLYGKTRDIVYCLKCQSWPSITCDFFTRQRSNNWPSPELLDKIADLDCLVVAIGSPSSFSRDIEWRLSFSVAEKKLIHEMCDPYFNCMMALKAIKNKYIVYSNSDKSTPFCSYFIKTACLWMCETFPHKDYSLMDLIRKILDWLIDCYKRRNLPHYFIPRQNLIGHLPRELCEQTRVKLTVLKTDLWKIVISSHVSIDHVELNVINNMCNTLNITGVTVSGDCAALETILLNHPGATDALEKANALLCTGSQLHRTLEQMKTSEMTGRDLIASMFVSLERYIGQGHPSEVFRLPEEIIIPIIDNIEGIVPNGYGDMVKQLLYRSLGDLYTYLFIYLRNKCSQNDAAIYENRPLHYYKLGAEMTFPDKWCDKGSGGQAHVIIYHYLIGNYEALKRELIEFEPILVENKENDYLMNRLISIGFNSRSYLMMDAWAMDKKFQKFAKSLLYFRMNPVTLVFYIKAKVSLKDRELENASAIVKEMKARLKTIFCELLRDVTMSLIEIIEIETLELMRMLYSPKKKIVVDLIGSNSYNR